MGNIPQARLPGILWAGATFILSTSLLCAGFPPFNCPEAAWFCLLPWLAWMHWRKPGARQTLVMAGCSSWVAWMFQLWWLRHVHVVGPVFLGAWCALFPAAWLWGVHRWMRGDWDRNFTRRVGFMLSCAALWVVLEWVRSWLLTGFGWNPLAATQWNRPALLQILPWTGQWGLSFVIAFFNVALLCYARRQADPLGSGPLRRLAPELYVGLLLILGVASLGFAGGILKPMEAPTIRLVVVQPNIPQDRKWDDAWALEIQDTLVDLTRKGMALSPKGTTDLVLWPEAATPQPMVWMDRTLDWPQRLCREIGVPILMGSTAYESRDGKMIGYNMVCAATPDEGVRLPFAAKRHLVPFGEYVPLRSLFGHFIEALASVGDTEPGRGPVVTDIPLAARRSLLATGALVCYEDVFGYLAAENVRAGAALHFVATNNVWYGEEWGAEAHAIHCTLRAAETRRPVVRCGNAGWSGWFDEFGRMRQVVEIPGKGVYFRGVEAMDIAIDPRFEGVQTPYVRHGDWFAWLCLPLALAGFWRFRMRSA